MKFELISRGETTGVNPNRVDRWYHQELHGVPEVLVRWRPDTSNYRPRWRQTLTLLLAACRSTKVPSSRCHFVLPYRNFRVVPVRAKQTNAFSLFSHNSFPG